MKKLPNKYQMPLMMAFMLPTMLLGMPAVSIYAYSSDDVPFFETWLNAISLSLPLAVPMIVVVGTLVRFLVTKVLVEPRDY